MEEQDEDDREVKDIMMQAILVHVEELFDFYRHERNFKAYNQPERVNWEAHMELKLHRNEFHSTYRMEYYTFMQMVNIIREDITVDTIKALNSAAEMEPIYPELVCAIGLKFLAGGRTADIADWAGMSQASYHRLKHQFLNAIISAQQLTITFPTTLEEAVKTARGFEGLSNRGDTPVFRGCVGAIDGMLAQTYQPRDVPSTEQRAYYSGHYECFGVNVQAVCDSRCRFTYIATAAPGSTPDISAMQEVDIARLIEGLPPGFYLLGDAAYPISEQLLIPYSGVSRSDNGNDVFNYFLSQLRIQIEMAFGLLTTKFRIFRGPMDLHLENVSKVIEVCARLHNFIIDVQRPDLESEVTRVDEYSGLPQMTEQEQAAGYIPGHPEWADEGEPIVAEPMVNVYGTSITRHLIRNNIVQRGLRRPDRNIARRNREERQRAVH